MKSQLCKSCKKEFKPNHPIQRYCSSDCRIRFNQKLFYREKHPITIPARNCNICGKTYISNDIRRKTCSHACSVKFKNKKRNGSRCHQKLVRITGKCEVCGFSIPEALEAHHYTSEDCIVLCGSCHNIWHKISKEKYNLRHIVVSSVSNHLLNSQKTLVNAPNIDESAKKVS
jgi:hypothetical protein